MGSLLMSQINYDSMSTVELKQYFLKHRGDSPEAMLRKRAAFQAYLDRIDQCPLRVIANPDDPNFDEKVRDAIRQKLELGRINKVQRSDSTDS
jgi:hypothetical protein